MSGDDGQSLCLGLYLSESYELEKQEIVSVLDPQLLVRNGRVHYLRGRVRGRGS